MRPCKACKKDFEPREINGIKATTCNQCLMAKKYENQKVNRFHNTTKTGETRQNKQKKEKDKRAKLRNKKKLSVSYLKKEADEIFSVYIRQRDKGVCVTCGAVKEWRYMQNGHYVPRGNNSTRYDEQNCNCQCVGCNVFKKGAMDEYALFLVRKYGAGILEKLNQKKKVLKQFTPQELLNLIEEYKQKILCLKK